MSQFVPHSDGASYSRRPYATGGEKPCDFCFLRCPWLVSNQGLAISTLAVRDQSARQSPPIIFKDDVDCKLI